MSAKEIPHLKIADFIHFVAMKKKTLKHWAFLQVKVSPEYFGETLQLLNFHLGGNEVALLELSPRSDLLVVVEAKNNIALSKFEKSMRENFCKDDYPIDVRGLTHKGLEQIQEILAPHIGHDDPIAALCLRRMARVGNTIVILDDDGMVLKLIQNALGGLGNVIVAQDTATFLRYYKEYAPNIAFIDIHLRDGASGIDLLPPLIKDVDPYAHVIMISSDSQIDTIRNLKDKGARGFVLKPIKRGLLLDHFANAPTFHMRD